jgi:hypothetical protein
MLCSQKILEKLSRRLKGLFHFFKKASVWVLLSGKNKQPTFTTGDVRVIHRPFFFGFLKQHWGQHCGDIELVGYLPNAAGPVPLVLDLRITHDRVGSTSDPTLNGHLHYPNNLDKSLNDTDAQLKSKCGNQLVKTTALRINLNLEGSLSHLNLTLTPHTHKFLVY